MAHGLADQHFRSYEEVKNWIDSWIASKDNQFFQRGIRTLPERWEKSYECLTQNETKYALTENEIPPVSVPQIPGIASQVMKIVEAENPDSEANEEFDANLYFIQKF
ncbi:mariner Mos1 transposase [Trichonephila clavipes]|nr:mariner Mos1 transposase [Trichonephila clavipes]